LGLEQEIRSAFGLAAAQGWQSHDPFDLLLSPYLRWLPGRSALGARVAVQVGRRTGRGLRRALRVPRHEEPKALADFLRAASILSADGNVWAEPLAESLSAHLSGGVDAGTSRRGWGIGFPYVSRFVNVTPNTPNAYTTSCVCEALLDAAELVDGDRALQAAEAGCRFLADDLGSFAYDGDRWQRYWPGYEDRIVNVQALVASLFARAAAILEDEGLRDRADAAVETVVTHQRPDGSWPYGADTRGNFVDGFHSGFVLQALAEYAERRPERASVVRDALDRGMEYFRRHLVGPDGLPLDFADGTATRDAQSVAQCIQTLIVAGDGERDVVSAVGLWREADRLGASPLERGRGLVSLRWSLGPGVLAAAHLGRAMESA
jgi:hypothetical protein